MRLSFVLAVHRQQAYVRACVESILGQDFADLELIAVDDASPDHAPAILDELAAADPRVRVEHLPARAGADAARDAGLALAGGDYVWFVDATDLLPERSLAAVVEALAAQTPDVLVVHHQTADVIGRTRPGLRRRELRRAAEEGPAPLERRRALAALAPDAWNKLFRRDLLEGLGLRFAGGGLGELGVCWSALLAAERIAAQPEVAYVRRRPPSAPADRSPFDAFAQYDAVFGVADARAQLPAKRRQLLVDAMYTHELALLRELPHERQREFFGQMSAALGRHRREGERLPPGRVAKLVAHDSWAAYRALQRAMAARRSLSRRRARARKRREGRAERRRKAALERHYRARLRQPIDPTLAVFASYWYRDCSCNPRAIYERARALVPEMRGVWVVRPGAEKTVPAGVDYVVSGTRDYYDAIARARYLVNNVGFPDHVVKRAGQVHVMTHHGTPLKQMGVDLAGTARARRTNFDALVRRVARWDFAISANPFTTPIFERVYPGTYETLETGYPRNDALANATAEEYARIRAGLGIGAGQRAVLYAPTHREYEPRYEHPVDLAALADGLGPGVVVMARLHYFTGADPHLRELHRSGRILDVAGHPSIEELCIAADALVTDYSSIMFDYAVLDRPIVIHAPDWEVYRDMRGTYFDLMAEPPGPVARDDAELLELLRSGAAAGEEADALRAAFRARFCSLEDGRAAERVVRRVWLGEGEREPARAPVGAGTR